MIPFPRSCAARFAASHALAPGRWLAYEASRNRCVVVRLVRNPDLVRYGVAARFSDEQELRASIAHPCLVPVIAFGVDGDRAWVATEHRPGPVGACDRRTVIGIARALQLAHVAGLLHRDIRPSNVLAGALTDFGLARWSGEPLDPEWTAPEVLAGAPSTIRADLFALGRLSGSSDERACAGEPGARFPSAAALADALERSPADDGRASG